MVLFKMLNRGLFHDINGCISTGKEVCNAVLPRSCFSVLVLMSLLFWVVKFSICVWSLILVLSNRQTYIMLRSLMVRNWQSKCTKPLFLYSSMSLDPSICCNDLCGTYFVLLILTLNAPVLSVFSWSNIRSWSLKRYVITNCNAKGVWYVI